MAPELQHLPDDREERITVEGGYRLLGKGEVAFTLGEYVTTEMLIIDPAFIYSTYPLVCERRVG